MRAAVSGQYALGMHRHFMSRDTDPHIMMEKMTPAQALRMPVDAANAGHGCPHYIDVVLPDGAAVGHVSVRDIVRAPSLASQLLEMQPGATVKVKAPKVDMDLTPYATYLHELGNLNLLDLSMACGTLDLCLGGAPQFENRAWSDPHKARLKSVFKFCDFVWDEEVGPDGTVTRKATDTLRLYPLGRTMVAREVRWHRELRADIVEHLTGNTEEVFDQYYVKRPYR